MLAIIIVVGAVGVLGLAALAMVVYLVLPGDVDEALEADRPTLVAPSVSGSGGLGPAGAIGGETVRLDLHVMSQCPFAVKLLDTITPMARRFGPALDLRLHYIGRDQEGRLTSMHGDSEVQGDLLQICAHQHGTRASWLAFIDCQNERYRDIPEGWEGCALRAGVDPTAVQRCAYGPEGQGLLRASFSASVAAGARGSPTIFVAGERWTGDRSEQTLARGICAHFVRGAPPACASVPQPTPVTVMVLRDSRCTRAECDTAAAERELRSQLQGARFTPIGYGTPEGRSLFAAAGAPLLPAFVVHATVTESAAGQRALRNYQRSGDYHVQSIGRFDARVGVWSTAPAVSVRILEDRRCATRECKTVDRFERFIKRQVPEASIDRLDYSSPEGGALWRRLKGTVVSDRPLGLPLAVFGPAIAQHEKVFGRLERRMKKAGSDYVFGLGSWDPESEVCDNSRDDDGDGRVDCGDPDCRDQLVCRPDKRRRLTLFIMSECPHAIKVLDAMGEVLDAFGRDRSKMDFRIEFVGTVGSAGSLSSMHGESEVAEDLREICAQHHYRREYVFMDYIRCRNDDIRSTEWQRCATGRIDPAVIRACAEGPEGQRLLRESFELTKSMGMTGSPSWLLNNRHEMKGRTPEKIRAAFCDRNPMPECSRRLSDG